MCYRACGASETSPVSAFTASIAATLWPWPISQARVLALSALAARYPTNAGTMLSDQPVWPSGVVLNASAGRGAPERSTRSDRKSVVWGKSVLVRVDLGGGRGLKKKKK